MTGHLCIISLILVSASVAAQVSTQVKSTQNPTESMTRESPYLKDSTRAAELIGIDERLRARLSALVDSSAERAAIVEEARRSGERIEENLAARIAVREIAQFEQSERLREVLTKSGLPSAHLHEWNDHSKDPREILRTLRANVGTNKEGQIVFRNVHEPLITNPSLTYPDDAMPGVVPLPFKDAPRRIWRAGFPYAGALAIKMDNGYKIFCSGTLLDSHYLVTAAHCLLDAGNESMVNKGLLRAFFPFQGGNETAVDARGHQNKGLRGASITDVHWAGEKKGLRFPRTKREFTFVIRKGLDLAMLKLEFSGQLGRTHAMPIVKLYSGEPKTPPFTTMGYGSSDVSPSEELSLGIGERPASPHGLDENVPHLYFGAYVVGEEAGICDGDSGGGLFAGPMDGTETTARLLAVASGLMSNKRLDKPEYCIGEEQAHTSVISEDNRAFVCEFAPGACS